MSPTRLEWRVGATLVGLILEILWSALWPATGFIGLYLTLSLLDAWLFVPGIVQLACFALAFGASGLSLWRRLRRVRWPTRRDALRRMELDGTLPGRPLSEMDDEIAEGASDEAATLWRHHKERQRLGLERAEAALPRSDLPRRDPHAFRVMVAMVFLVSLVAAGSDRMNRLGLAFQPDFSFSLSSAVHVTAWVNPPAFTGLAPVFLDPGGPKDRFTVPQDSVLVVRVSDARGTPTLLISDPSTKVRATRDDAGLFDITHALTGSTSVRLKDRGRTLGEWHFAVTPDAAPFAAFEENPKGNLNNGLEFAYVLHDDYGIGAAFLSVELDEVLRPRTPEDEDLDGDVAKSKPAQSERQFDVALPISSGGEKSISERTVLDLTDHHYAGLDVVAQLVVSDLGGQEGRSDSAAFRLPQRDFFEPLALAIVEQRRNLARDPTDWAFVMRGLEALTLAPERFFEDLTVYVGLRTAYWQLDRAMPETLALSLPTIDLLWDVALHVEDGNLSLGEQELRAIARALQDALARGAPMDEIQRLLKRYQEALDRYLAALAEKNLAGDPDLADPPPADGPTIDQQDLADLLKAIEDLARTGDTAAAAELLAQLQRMLENMTMAGKGGMNGPESELAGRIEDLSDLIGKERALMDETLRRSQQEERGGGDGGQQPDLADDQADLRGELEGLEGQEGTAGRPGKTEQAGQAMSEAEKALRDGDTRRALHAQRRAVDALRGAAEELAEQLQQSMEARGAGGPDGEHLDPLGRTEGRGGSGLGDHIKIPEERDLQRAREILKELQKRAADPARPDIELDYLERLLKRF
jgi:uncharacterized protein (TIGR02302 family)